MSLQSARIVAGTLTLLAREIRESGPPANLWSPQLTPDFIRDAAALVERGEALPLWFDERRPARGLVIYRHSAWESEFLGFGAGRLMGPFMMVDEQVERELRVRRLAALAISESRAMGHKLITIKTCHDPAVLRGFLGENFVLAEIGASFSGAVPDEPVAADSPSGFSIVEGDEAGKLAEESVAALGDFFYDGHFRHDVRPGPETARRLWSRVALDDLAGAADPALILWDQRRDRAAALATVRPGHAHACLSILAVAAAYRGRGLGRYIMLEILNRLAGRAASLRVETASYNLPALKLYTSLGFAPLAPLAALHYHG